MSISWPPPGKWKRNQGGRSSWFPPQGTWTHKFLCLGDKQTNEIPQKIKKFELQENGLERKRVVNRDDGPALFNNKLFESYPKLKDAGDCELLRTGAAPKKFVGHYWVYRVRCDSAMSRYCLSKYRVQVCVKE